MHAVSGRTRLISRWRTDFRPTPAGYWWQFGPLEVVNFVMERKMLESLRRRAEGYAPVAAAAAHRRRVEDEVEARRPRRYPRAVRDDQAGDDTADDVAEDTVDDRVEIEPTGHAVVRCDGLTKRFGDRVAVDDISFAIAAGESYGLLGPNGAGKTTTISMLCGLLEPDAGSVAINGETLGRDPRLKSVIGFVPQDVALYPELTGPENLRFFARLYGLSDRRLSERVTAALQMAGLSERAGDRVEAYSGGMKRRLNIAAGLLHEPTLLVLDEPTVGVDPQSRNAIMETIADLRQGGLAVLYTSHYMEEVEKLCDRVGIMDEGTLIAEGTVSELIALVGESDQLTLAIEGDSTAFAAEATRIEGITTATPAAGRVALLADDGPARLPQLIAVAGQRGLRVTSVDVVRPNLESVFLHLTGKALRD